MLQKRGGYAQLSPAFASIIGRKMMHIEQTPWLTPIKEV